MKKKPIGILDGGLEGINIFNNLCHNYPYESFIYITDYKNYPYEGKEIETIQKYVSASCDELLKNEVSAIIVVSNSIIEYCNEYLDSLSVPVIKVVDTIIEYCNKEYEHKNIAFIAKQYIIKANLYQKNFKYNHLYNISSEELEEVIMNKQIKTAKSFAKTHECLKSILNKDIDLVVYVDSYIENLTIEFKEYISDCNFIDLSTILFDEYKKKNQPYEKGKGEHKIISQFEKKELKKIIYWINGHYKYIKVEEQKENKFKDGTNKRTNKDN